MKPQPPFDQFINAQKETTFFHEFGDGVKLVICGEQRETFKAALIAAKYFLMHGKVNFYAFSDIAVQLLSHTDSQSDLLNKTIVPQDPVEFEEVLWNWLSKSRPGTAQPDSDGTVNVGFEVSSGGCYKIRIKPIWIIYGK